MQVQERRTEDVAAVLLPGLRAGSSHAWAALYDRLAPGIHRFATSSLSDPDAAEDVVVETLAHAARDIARFDPAKASLTTWIYTIARRRVQAELRWCWRRKSVPPWAQVSFEDLPELSGGDDLGAETAARLDAQRRITELSSLLSDAERETLALSCAGELPDREIAAVVGRSPRAVNSLLSRARRKARRTEIEGELLVVGGQLVGRRIVGSVGDFMPYGRRFTGADDQYVDRLPSHGLSFSPAGDEVLYHSRAEHGVFRQPPKWGHIWKAKRDWSGAVNLTQAAGLTGMNWGEVWSPDATMIAFEHWDEPRGPWDGPGEPWLMWADGSAARQALPKEQLPALGSFAGMRWSRDGSRLFCIARDAPPNAAPIDTDFCGRRIQLVPRQPDGTSWSPDGSRKAVTRLVRGRAAGEAGHWRQLHVARADGSRGRVLVEQFIPDAAVEQYRPTAEDLRRAPQHDDRRLALQAVGPVGPTWSPSGDKIAFLAALPLDPEGPHFWLQVDAWVYDLVTRRLMKLTDEPHIQSGLVWL